MRDRSGTYILTWRRNKRRRPKFTGYEENLSGTCLSKGRNLLRVTQPLGVGLGFGGETVGWHPKPLPRPCAPPAWHHCQERNIRSDWIDEQWVLGWMALTSKEAGPCKRMKATGAERRKEVFRIINLNQTANTAGDGAVVHCQKGSPWWWRGWGQRRKGRRWWFRWARHELEGHQVWGQKGNLLCWTWSPWSPLISLYLHLWTPKFNSKSSINSLVYGFYGSFMRRVEECFYLEQPSFF